MWCNHNNTKMLGYYYGIGALLSEYPRGIKGWYFLNGETNSVWMWDIAKHKWVDTNSCSGGEYKAVYKFVDSVTETNEFFNSIFSDIPVGGRVIINSSGISYEKVSDKWIKHLSYFLETKPPDPPDPPISDSKIDSVSMISYK